MRSLTTVLFALCLAGCESGNEVINPGTLAFPLQVKLRAGTYVRLPQLRSTVVFDSVTSDSRCPIGFECFWAGDGASRLRIYNDAGPAVTCTLHTTLLPQLITADGFTVQLKELDPFPRAGVTIDPPAYVVTLEIALIKVRL